MLLVQWIKTKTKRFNDDVRNIIIICRYQEFQSIETIRNCCAYPMVRKLIYYLFRNIHVGSIARTKIVPIQY